MKSTQGIWWLTTFVMISFSPFNKLGSRHAFVFAQDAFASHARRGDFLGGWVSLRVVRLFPTHPPLKLKKTDGKTDQTNSRSTSGSHTKVLCLFWQCFCLKHKQQGLGCLRSQEVQLPVASYREVTQGTGDARVEDREGGGSPRMNLVI